MYYNLALRFVDNNVVRLEGKIPEGRHERLKEGEVFLVVHGRAAKREGEDLVDAVGGAEGHYGGGSPGIEAFDYLVCGREERLAGHRWKGEVRCRGSRKGFPGYGRFQFLIFGFLKILSCSCLDLSLEV